MRHILRKAFDINQMYLAMSHALQFNNKFYRSVKYWNLRQNIITEDDKKLYCQVANSLDTTKVV